jgi:hypothetical protein
VLAAVVLGSGANGPAAAQTDAERELINQFGGYELSAGADGFLFTYDLKGVLPIPPPLFQAGIPEARTSLNNSPNGQSLASLAWPGSLIADLATALAQSCDPLSEPPDEICPGDPDQPPPIPAYPVRATAFYPGAQTEERQEPAPGTAMVAIAGPVATEAVAQISGSDLPSWFRIGTINTHVNAQVVEGQVVARSRVEMAGIDLFAGLIHIDSLVTDIVSTTNGSEAASGGRTAATGVKLLGLNATLDDQGLHLVAPEPAAGSPAPGGPLSPLTDPLLGEGSPLAPVGDALAPALEALNQLVTQLLGTTGTVNELLAAAGIEIRLFDPVETKTGSAVTRTSGGLALTLTYEGGKQEALSELIGQVSSQLPADEVLPGAPSPQALVNLMRETHIVGISMAPGTATANVNSPFSPSPAGSAAPVGGGTGLPSASAPLPSSGFSTPLPALPGSPGAAPGATQPIAASARPLAWWLVALLLLSVPFWAAGTSRLADNVLAPVASGCPEGKHRPQPTGRN